MIIKVQHKRAYGKDLFYPMDEFTTKFLEATRFDLVKKAFTLRQITAFKILGFEIDIYQDQIKIS